MREIARRLINGVWRTVDVDEANGNGGSQTIQTVPFSLTAADLKAAATHDLVAAVPGAAIVLSFVAMRYVFVTTGYSDGAVNFAVNNFDHGGVTGFISRAASRYAFLPGANGEVNVATAEQINHPMYLETVDLSGDPGDGTLSGLLGYVLWTP